MTLVFLILQIRQNTGALRSTTIQAVLQFEMEFGRMLVDNAATWEKILSAAPIADAGELRKAVILFNMFMIDSESRYQQHETGFLDPQSWEARLKTLPRVVRLPIFDEWRKSIGGLSHSEDFLKIIDGLAETHSNKHAE